MFRKLLVVAVVAAALAGASARCPNLCSGHGKCLADDTCDCFSYLDAGNTQRDSWTGPDCSLRVCPLGNAWSSSASADQTAHPAVECSNAGTCDRKTGVCVCNTGYVGDACQRTSCPNDCSSHGRCRSQSDLAASYATDFAASYTYASAWDATKHYACDCDYGYVGHDCSKRQCMSGTDPEGGAGNTVGRECSGRGTCDYESGVCNCYSGFFGQACGEQTALL